MGKDKCKLLPVLIKNILDTRQKIIFWINEGN